MDKRSSIDCKSCANRRSQNICDMCHYGELFEEQDAFEFEDRIGMTGYLDDYEIDVFN